MLAAVEHKMYNRDALWTLLQVVVRAVNLTTPQAVVARQDRVKGTAPDPQVDQLDSPGCRRRQVRLGRE
jgi:hypothetical protein